MSRSRMTTLMLALLVAPLAVLASGCGGGGEEQTLIRAYFRAANVGDRGSLANIAMFAWNPREQGTVSSPSVENVTEEQSRPLRIRELNTAFIEAQEAQTTFDEEKVAYQDENFDAINRVLEAEREGDDVGRRDREVQEAWTDWRDRTMELAKMVSDAQQELSAENTEAFLSLADPNNPLDLTQYDGQLITKEVQITATLEVDGAESEQQLTVVLQRAILDGGEEPIEGRWVVRSID